MRATRSGFARLALGAVACTLLVAGPSTSASADHCTEVRLLSGTGLLIHTGAVGCAGDMDVDTDYINPGSTNLLIRVFGAERPSDISTITFSGITGPTGRGGCTPGEGCVLDHWDAGEDAAGEPPGPYWDSRFMTISRNSSVDGGEAAITICFDDEGEHCEQRTYRTFA